MREPLWKILIDIVVTVSDYTKRIKMEQFYSCIVQHRSEISGPGFYKVPQTVPQLGAPMGYPMF